MADISSRQRKSARDSAQKTHPSEDVLALKQNPQSAKEFANAFISQPPNFRTQTANENTPDLTKTSGKKFAPENKPIGRADTRRLGLRNEGVVANPAAVTEDAKNTLDSETINLLENQSQIKRQPDEDAINNLQVANDNQGNNFENQNANDNDQALIEEENNLQNALQQQQANLL